jgi:hypothetical protein
MLLVTDLVMDTSGKAARLNVERSGKTFELENVVESDITNA